MYIFFFLNENYIHSLALLLNMNVRLLRKINFSFSLLEQERIFLGEYIILMRKELQCVPRNGFGSADCDTIYTIYLSLLHNQLIQNLYLMNMK